MNTFGDANFREGVERARSDTAYQGALTKDHAAVAAAERDLARAKKQLAERRAADVAASGRRAAAEKAATAAVESNLRTWIGIAKCGAEHARAEAERLERQAADFEAQLRQQGA